MKRLYYLGITILSMVSLCSGCASNLHRSTVILEYSDFGPQAMAYRILGPKKLPWEPDTPLLIGQGKVKVVVYRDIPLEKVQKHFPPDTKNQTDYRYLPYVAAMNYLESRISQNILVKVTQKLTYTKETLNQHLNQ